MQPLGHQGTKIEGLEPTKPKDQNELGKKEVEIPANEVQPQNHNTKANKQMEEQKNIKKILFQ